LTDLSKVSQVQTMSDFPFANAVLNRSDTSGIVSLLKNMGESLGQNYDNWSVPQAVCQSIDGERILIVPAKTHDKGIGSGETAGHIVVKTQEDFDRADYQFCLNKLSPRLYSSSDLDMRKFL
jgi:hypothetical protein